MFELFIINCLFRFFKWGDEGLDLGPSFLFYILAVCLSLRCYFQERLLSGLSFSMRTLI